jgi:hypothetical protein
MAKYYDQDNIRWSSREKGHIGGMMNLIRFQNPEAFAEPSQHQLLVQLRQHWVCCIGAHIDKYNAHLFQIALSLERRRDTFLSSTEWLTKPWQGLHKTYYDTLWDTIAQIPAIFEAWDYINSNLPSHDLSDQAAMLKRQCYILEMKLSEWHDELSTSCRSFTAAESKLLCSHIGKMAAEDLPDILALHGAWYLFAWMMHWTARIILYSMTPLIYLRFPPASNERIVNASVSIGSYCLCIARSVKHFLGPNPVGLLLEMSMRIPVSVVQKALTNPILRVTGDPKLSEAESILKSVGGTQLGLSTDELVTKTPNHNL